MDTIKNNTNNQKQEETQVVSNEINAIVNQEVQKDKDLVVKTENIHFMPAKFLPQSPKKQFSAKQKIILAVIGFVLFLIIVVGAMLWWANASVPNVETNNEFTPPANNVQTPEENETTTEEPEETIVMSRDERINNDLDTITQALSNYFNVFGSYPNNLSALTPDYLSTVPRQENGSAYDYSVTDQGSDFEFLITFDGSQTPALVGDYKWTRAGLSIYVEEEEEENNGNLPPPPPPPPGNNNNNDVDADQLTIAEESLFSTDANDNDSDNDGYLDGSEIVNLYSPIASGELLINSGLVTVFTNTEFGYRIWYPSTWVAEGLGGDLSTIIIAADSESGDMISILAEANTAALSVEERLSEIQATLEGFSNMITTTFGQADLAAWQTTDQRHLVYLDDNYTYMISYDVTEGNTPSFETTLQMMLNSFELTDVQ